MLLLLTIITIGTASAADYNLSGTVYDQYGTAVSGATVITNTSVSTTTNTAGAYTYLIAEGNYTLTASKSGYTSTTTANINVSGADSTGNDITINASSITHAFGGINDVIDAAVSIMPGIITLVVAIVPIMVALAVVGLIMGIFQAIIIAIRKGI